MRILFVDVTRDFGLTTPYEKPLGGTQSAVAYLSREMARAGHEVTVINAVPEPRIEDGVRFLPWQAFPWPGTENVDAIIIVLATRAMIEAWHGHFGDRPLWLQWCHHDADQPAVAHWADPAMHKLFDGIILISEWQAKRYREAFGISWDKVMILRNGVSPAFLDLFPPDQPILTQKSPDPVLIYTSTPFRGLEVLLEAVPLIRSRVANTRIRVFSSLQVYGVHDTSTDPNAHLYERSRDLEGVEYVGSCSQQQLAQEMKSAWCLAYPNIFPETSCIAVMEALAAGCKIVTSHLGALPETTAGFASMIVNSRSRVDHIQRFAEMVTEVLLRIPRNVGVTEAELRGAVTYAQENCSWRHRVDYLTDWLQARLAWKRKG